MGSNKPSLITKGRYQLKFRGTKCLNCNHLLDKSDRFCPNCSQANSTKKLVLKDFFDEFFSSLVNYDSKLLKTLYTLLLKPGTITKDYIQGKRIPYTNPFRFLLSLAFLYFLMFTYGTELSKLDDMGFDEKIEESGPFTLTVDSDEIDIDSTKIKLQTQLALKQFDSITKAGHLSPETLEKIKKLDSDELLNKSTFSLNKDSLIMVNPKGYFASLKNESGINKVYLKMQFFNRLIKKDSIKSFEDAKHKYAVEETYQNKMAFNATTSLMRVVKEPGSWLNSTISKLPLVIFLFLPIFTVFIWVVYIRKKYTYTDHLIFSFHNQSLLFILLILSLIIDTIFKTASSGIFLLIFGFYLYKAMRKFYGQGRFKTIVKYIFLNTVFTFLAFLVVIVLFAGSVFTY
ncbi:hypothetical protein HME9304_02356 [Flagellimonas maritima]|uniref:DUF3667 domain-containing protein n=1 Tax=Flagellimonas maritima TaxID=1383885 RepID=A0A2Z4LUD1_9FLAO|nr:DUF3667 domain-containing protein [Allomuricauda aurantiaca]AWX45343.1 hypothetical protein HME9304_02356 [Allomuricauda aurantiaca]